MLPVQGSLLDSVQELLLEKAQGKKAEAGCGHRRQDKQPEVQEFTPEQIRGRPEGAAGSGGQTEGGQ